MPRVRLWSVLMAVGLVAVVAACGSSSSATSSGTQSSGTQSSGASTTVPAAQAPLYGMLPAAVRSAGVITVASSVGFPPFEFYGPDGKTIEGLDIDLMQALQPVLGVKFKVTDTRYPNIIPSMLAGRAELGWSAFGEDPQAEKTVNFVTYINDAVGSVIVAANSPLTSEMGLCGMSVGFIGGEDTSAIQKLSQQCTAAGKHAVSIKMFDKTADAVLAIESGQLDARVSDQANGSYEVKLSGGKLKLVNNIFPGQFFAGVVLLKNQTQLEGALQAGLQRLVTDGEYAKIFAKWGITASGVPQITTA